MGKKRGLTELPSHNGKLTSDMNFIKGNFKGFRVQIEILAAVFDWISKQQLNLLLFLSDWYWGELELTDLPGHDGKVTKIKKIIFISHQRYKVGNRDYCSHFSVTFETKGKYIIVFVRLIFGKRGVVGVTGPRREIDISFKGKFKGFRVQIEILAAIFDWISKQQLNLLLFLSGWYWGKLELTDLPGHEGKVT